MGVHIQYINKMGLVYFTELDIYDLEKHYII